MTDMPIHLYKNSTDVQFWQHCMFLLAILLPSMLDECKGSACILWRLINQIIYKKNKKAKATESLSRRIILLHLFFHFVCVIFDLLLFVVINEDIEKKKLNRKQWTECR